MKSTAPKMIIRGGGANDSMKTASLGAARLALGPVVAGPGPPHLKFAEGVAHDDPVEFGLAQAADHRRRLSGRWARPDQEVAPSCSGGPTMTVAKDDRLRRLERRLQVVRTAAATASPTSDPAAR